MEENLKNRRRAQELRKNQTKEENHLWYDFLKTYPVQFRRQYPVGCYYADFYCYEAKLVVELDGSQHYEPENVAADQKRTAYFAKHGLHILRFTNLDIWKSFAGVCEAIDLEVKKRTNRGK